VLNTQSYARSRRTSGGGGDGAALHPALQLYRVTVRRLDGTALVATCNIQGDEWLMSAAVQKWQPWVNIFGLDSTFAWTRSPQIFLRRARQCRALPPATCAPGAGVDAARLTAGDRHGQRSSAASARRSICR